ncbi:hypothetical protein BSKO_08690 [Bryopsis sp. KO-2023]|nr:hypothetical protein BSKO_08690 [Bryopsis sp. KO-2023]
MKSTIVAPCARVSPSLFRSHRCALRPASVPVRIPRATSLGVEHRHGRSESSRSPLASRAATTDAPTVVEYLKFSDNALEWGDLEKALEQKKISVGAKDVDPETGPANCGANRRTFGKDGPIRVKLYRDRAAWCAFCQKVWMQLELKQIPYEVEFIPLGTQGGKPEWYAKKFPNNTVPNMELDGEVVLESNPIMMKLEEVFPERPLFPEGAELGKIIPRLDAWISYLNGEEDAEEKFHSQLDEVESMLVASGGPYFLGKEISLVDIDAVTILERMNGMILCHKGVHMRASERWPALGRWYDAMDTHPEYLATKTDYFGISRILPLLFPKAKTTEKGKPYKDVIEGKNGAWKLPLKPLSETIESAAGENPEMDTYIAARQLIQNREAVVSFALQGCDEKDRDDVKDGVECALRHVATALLNGTNATELKVSSEEGIDGKNVVSALEFVRERVGVPRDFRLAQARQFRAHLNWMIDSVVA